eukprot:jgi/Mesen1/6868/ME000351S05982
MSQSQISGAKGFSNPFVLRIGTTFTGIGIGCGVGIGMGRPLDIRSVPMLGQSLSAVIGSVVPILNRVQRPVSKALSKLGVKVTGVQSGIGCGVGVGYGWGAGLSLKPGVAADISTALQALAAQAQERLRSAGVTLPDLPPHLLGNLSPPSASPSPSPSLSPSPFSLPLSSSSPPSPSPPPAAAPLPPYSSTSAVSSSPSSSSSPFNYSSSSYPSPSAYPLPSPPPPIPPHSYASHDSSSGSSVPGGASERGIRAPSQRDTSPAVTHEGAEVASAEVASAEVAKLRATNQELTRLVSHYATLHTLARDVLALERRLGEMATASAEPPPSPPSPPSRASDREAWKNPRAHQRLDHSLHSRQGRGGSQGAARCFDCRRKARRRGL